MSVHGYTMSVHGCSFYEIVLPALLFMANNLTFSPVIYTHLKLMPTALTATMTS